MNAMRQQTIGPAKIGPYSVTSSLRAKILRPVVSEHGKRLISYFMVIAVSIPVTGREIPIEAAPNPVSFDTNGNGFSNLNPTVCLNDNTAVEI